MTPKPTATTKMNLDVEKIATLLRECAMFVERNETSPLLYRGLEALQLYTDGKASSASNTTSTSTTTNTSSNNNNSSNNNHNNNNPKPAFQRPINKSSNLIANGWIEQQRRSKMRIVWKTVLASLVEARTPDEETTLWLQRQVINPHTNIPSTDLEALHQIPMKWLQDVYYVDFYGDFRFCLKVYNVHEDFCFRCSDEESCMLWIATLKSARENSLHKASASSSKSTNHNNNTSTSIPTSTSQDNIHNTTKTHNHNTNEGSSERMSIQELRAIAHGAGYNTRGMERADLERIAERHAPVSARVPPPPVQKTDPSPTTSTSTASKMNDNGTSSANTNSTSNTMNQNSRASPTTTAPTSNHHYSRNDANSSSHNSSNDLPNATNASRNMNGHGHGHTNTDDERLRQQRPPPINTEKTTTRSSFESVRFASNGFGFGGESGQRSKHPPPSSSSHTNTTNPNTFHTSMPQPPHHHFQQSQPQPSAPPPPPQQQQQPYNRANDPTSPINQKYAKSMNSNTTTHTATPNPNNTQDTTTSTTNNNINNNNNNNKGEEQVSASIQQLKRNILIHWALVPPQFNMLRSIDTLLTTIHKVFPPAFGINAHEYFTKWNAITLSDLGVTTSGGNHIMNSSHSGPDEGKLKKNVRKLRVFLHPDRLPKDFNSEQSFMCKMLWDVTNDAFEEFLKNKNDLDWIHK